MNPVTIQEEFETAQNAYRDVCERYKNINFGDAGFEEIKAEFLEKQAVFLKIEAQVMHWRNKNTMSNKLQKKIREVEEEHAEEILNNHLKKHDDEKRVRALLLLGGIRAVDRVTKNLSSQVMTALINFQKEDMHEQLGFNHFADFLTQSEFSPMSKHEFYNRKEIFEAEGAALYDTFNALKIPMSTRRLLAQSNAGQIAVEGDKLLIGGTEVATTDVEVVKEVVKSLADELRASAQTVEKKDKEIEQLKSKVETGTKEFEELRRAFDSLQEGSSHDKAFMRLMSAFVQMNTEIRRLTDREKEEKCETILNTLWVQINLTRDAYNAKKYQFEGFGTPTANVSELAKKALADFDFGDEE